VHNAPLAQLGVRTLDPLCGRSDHRGSGPGFLRLCRFRVCARASRRRGRRATTRSRGSRTPFRGPDFIWSNSHPAGSGGANSREVRHGLEPHGASRDPSLGRGATSSACGHSTPAVDSRARGLSGLDPASRERDPPCAGPMGRGSRSSVVRKRPHQCAPIIHPVNWNSATQADRHDRSERRDPAPLKSPHESRP
jgi:hypothetical protein